MTKKAEKETKQNNFTVRYNVYGMPGCCGIDVIVNLELIRVTARSAEVNWEVVCRQNNINTLLATLTPEQEKIAKILEKTPGWSCTELPRNPNTGNILYLWTYTKVDTLEYREEDEEDDYY